MTVQHKIKRIVLVLEDGRVLQVDQPANAFYRRARNHRTEGHRVVDTWNSCEVRWTEPDRIEPEPPPEVLEQEQEELERTGTGT